jgi:glycosyltransferase involved in cell wall biosynthesis
VNARPNALVAVSSSCQLYSGTGTALFDWLRYARDAIDFSLLIDTGEPVNFGLAARFCDEAGIALIPSEPEQVPGCPDFRPAGIGRALQSRRWDIVECVSWASAATNMEVLANRPDSRLIYTPHSQPLWTLPGNQRFFMVPTVFRNMLRTSDLVSVDSPNELAAFEASLIDPARILHVPLGVDTRRFSPGPDPGLEGEARLLTVADFREHRKRPDLVLKAYDAALAVNPGLRPVLLGRDSERLAISPYMAARAERLGFVSKDELIRQYRSARALLLLSDFEAFGIPIAEALCCGTPVIMHDQPEPVSVFGDLPGVTVVRNTDLNAVRDALLAHAARIPDRQAIAAAAADRFGFANTYGRKLARVLSLVRNDSGPPATRQGADKSLAAA